MGININALKFIGAAKQGGVSFSRTLTIGRQSMYVDRPALMRLLSSNIWGNPLNLEGVDLSEKYAEWLLRLLGATQIDSIDCSDYEGATILQDLNSPIPDGLKNRYSAVLEVGTLEHIFNFPVAIRNCMELVDVGGHLICCTVANNYCGHGFYQFSPELFHRVLTPENGFRIERMVVCDAYYESNQYSVLDRAVVGHRIEIVGPYPVMLMVQAQRTASVPIFAKPPQQSDYDAAWAGTIVHADQRPAKVKPDASLAGAVRRVLPNWLFERVRAYRSARQYNAAWFKPETAAQPEAPRGRI
jgi:hypothetical protein